MIAPYRLPSTNADAAAVVHVLILYLCDIVAQWDAKIMHDTCTCDHTGTGSKAWPVARTNSRPMASLGGQRGYDAILRTWGHLLQ